MIEKRISVLRHGCQKSNQQQEVASESNRLIEVGPGLEIDCRVQECTSEEVDEREDGDQSDDANDLYLFGRLAEVGCVEEE